MCQYRPFEIIVVIVVVGGEHHSNVFMLYFFRLAIKNSLRYFHVFILYFFTNKTHISFPLLLLLAGVQLFFYFILYFHPKKKTFLCGFEMYKCFCCLRVCMCVCVCERGKWKNNAPKNGILIFLQYIFISI